LLQLLYLIFTLSGRSLSWIVNVVGKLKDMWYAKHHILSPSFPCLSAAEKRTSRGKKTTKNKYFLFTAHSNAGSGVNQLQINHRSKICTY
jgi:hypothetical protein